MKKITAAVCALLLLFSFAFSAIPAKAASRPTLTTTLKDNTVQKGQKKTFDVWARNSKGEKVDATVTLNGVKVKPAWNDEEKASYTLVFTKEGRNIVEVTCNADGREKKLTYHITYQKTAAGESIGTAVWSVELFTIGCGYLVYPVEMPIYEGENAAQQLIRLLHSHGFAAYYGGKPDKAFYLGYISDGDAQGDTFSGYNRSGKPSNPKKLNLKPQIPGMLDRHLRDTMTDYNPQDYINNWEGYLGEFVISNGSGWMYCVNNVFPNVGFADCYPSDGDVVRVQFTLGYGADIGGAAAMGTDVPGMDTPVTSYFDVGSKDRLTVSICKALASGYLHKAGVQAAYAEALSVIETLDASQSQLDRAAAKLDKAVSNAPSEPDPVTPKPAEPEKTKPEHKDPDSTIPGASESPEPSAVPSDPSQPDATDDTAPEETKPVSTVPSEEGTAPRETETSAPTDASSAPADTSAPSDSEQQNNYTAVIIVVAVVIAAGAAAGIYYYRKKKHQEG